MGHRLQQAHADPEPLPEREHLVDAASVAGAVTPRPIARLKYRRPVAAQCSASVSPNRRVAETDPGPTRRSRRVDVFPCAGLGGLDVAAVAASTGVVSMVADSIDIVYRQAIKRRTRRLDSLS